MSWGRHVRNKTLDLTVDAGGALEPNLLSADREVVRREVSARIPSYTPEWNNPRPDDAGVALLRTHGTMAEHVHDRLNRVPRRMLFDMLAIAGVGQIEARPPAAVLAIEAKGQPDNALVLPEGFVFSATGDLGPIAFEIEQSTEVVAGTVGSVAVLSDGWDVRTEAADLRGMAPFGRFPTIRAELWLGIDATSAPSSRISFAVQIPPASPRPAAVSNLLASRSATPLLRWEARTQPSPTEMVVERDDTEGLTRSGVVQLRAPDPSLWSVSTLPGRPGDAPMRWIRVRSVIGAFPDTVRLNSITLNGVRAVAQRSIRDEVAQPLLRPDQGRSTYRLSQVPIVADSIVLEIADAAADPFGTGGDTRIPTSRRWEERQDLGSAQPDDQVFSVDYATGILTFGDGINGKREPKGYRNVVARTYSVASSAGQEDSLPVIGDELTATRAPRGLGPATVISISTGAPTESPDELLARGPAEIRSRRRAVAPADYATRALGTNGVDIARAHCLPAFDPRENRGARAGVVGVIVLPQRVNDDAPTVPDEPTLRLVSEFLAREEGIAGAEVIATGPRYRQIAMHAQLIARDGTDLAAVASQVRDRVDQWLDPYVGGAGGGWPFGGTVRWAEISRLLMSEQPGLVAVSQPSFRTGGRRLAPCTDVELDVDELTWPGLHVLDISFEESSS